MNIYIYKEIRNKGNKAITDAKKDHYQQYIKEASHSQKALFKCVDSLFGKKKTSALPTHDDTTELCDRMASFFTDKIAKIHEELESTKGNIDPMYLDQVLPDDACFTDFSPLSEEEVEKIIRNSPSKTCSLDPLPTSLLKECLDLLVPIITKIINKSFAESHVPKSFKLAAVTPILKKANLIADILKNYRPISNLPFLSKLLEKAASKQLISHKESKHLREKFQSAYRTSHSTETAMSFTMT